MVGLLESPINDLLACPAAPVRAAEHETYQIECKMLDVAATDPDDYLRMSV
jgi:hypothetical protein